ncbi:hypothetical protein RUM43_005872 [Polyplax serrata]|uniref:Uncharacterized protein n=1 Tax=Polyplax serrata TaxID=468196 RepID=A0AAN8P0K7_POLSC
MKAKKVPSCRVEANGGDSSLAGHNRRLRSKEMGGKHWVDRRGEGEKEGPERTAPTTTTTTTAGHQDITLMRRVRF